MSTSRESNEHMNNNWKEVVNAEKIQFLASSGCVVAVRLRNNSILLIEKKEPQNVLQEYAIPRIHKASEETLLATCGLVMDCLHTVRIAQVENASMYLSTETYCKSDQIVDKISEYLKSCCTKPNVRPLGVTVLVAAQDENKLLHLFRITTGGEKCEYQACAIGHNSVHIMSELELLYDNICDSPASALMEIMKLLNETDFQNIRAGVVKEKEANFLTIEEMENLLNRKNA